VDPITLEVTIARPQAEVFEYLVDIANHAEFTDHFRVEWRLTREDSYGRGAGARFKVRAPATRFPWADATLVEVIPPQRIVEAGRTGKYNRIRTVGVYELEPVSAGSTRVRYTYETEPKFPSDRLIESVGGSGRMKRRLKKALRRLQSILEEDYDRGTRPTIAGGPRKPATGAPIR
jgi:uncharacterized protein YndB with AHSA1/START domain